MHYLLEIKRAPGDTLALSALVRDLHALQPETKISVCGPRADEIFLFDYRVTHRCDDARHVLIRYNKTIDDSRHDHTQRYLYAGHVDFEEATGIHVLRGPCKPELILSPAELQRPIPEPYAVVASGTKSDIPLKQWPIESFQKVIDLTPELLWVQVGNVGGDRILNHNQPLQKCDNLLGRTSIRNLFQLIKHAELVLCHVSLPMLIASAFGTPCVVVAGGREDPWLHEESGVRYLHTIGQLDCCATHGCRRVCPRRVHTMSDFPPNWECTYPVGDVGRCMTLITPEMVVGQVRSLLKS